MSTGMTRKSSINDLALLGGPPAFAEVLHVGRPNIGDRGRFLARVNDMLDRRWLSNNGPYVQELEEKLAAYLGVRNCLAVCNATVGLELAARGLGLQGEVILPSFTFVATAHAMHWLGLTPVFCDIDPSTHNIDPKKAERLVTTRTTGILGVHVWGRACDVEGLAAFARRRGLKLLFDAAHALGCSYNGSLLGGCGDAEVFSFHATKFFNTFEGGAITTNDDRLAEDLRRKRNFGFAGMDQVVGLGTNGKMSEVSAAMGLGSLESLDEFIQANHEHYRAYLSGLKDVPGLQVVRYDEAEKSNYQYVILEIDPERADLDRDLLVRLLHAENVRARRYFYPGCHQMEPYRSMPPWAGLELPATERLTRRVMQLPTGTALQASEVQRICELIRFILENSGAIRRAAESHPRAPTVTSVK